MALYHKEIGFPAKMKFRPIDGLVPSAHALHAANTDRYGSIPIPTEFTPEEWEVIEIEVINGALNKLLVRKPLDHLKDVVMAFIPKSKLIKTVWINLREDGHKTLDKRAYDMPWKIWVDR